mmetsp:Transcript_32920/g.70446  ORF Transcript_32920/g.70446 Transcript_32920/m.70446 type:complete len:151 (-) Transcript_32920:54-506(-)
MAAIASIARISAKRFIARSSNVRFMATIKYTPSHEYIKIDGEVGTVGITSHAADALGDVVFVDLPSVGNSFVAGDSFGSVESVKAASDVYSPVAGEVLEVNGDLDSNPGLVNEAPFVGGWFMKLKITDQTELSKLLDEAAYKQHCEDDKH